MAKRKKEQTHPLGVLWERDQFFTARASETVRNSAIAGLAAAWLFSGSSDGDLSKLSTAPDGLLWAGAFFALTLGVDIAHYAVAATLFRNKAIEYENEGKVNTDVVELPPWIPDVIRGFWYAKTALLAVAYVILMVQLIHAAS